MHIEYRLESQKERNQKGDLGVSGEDNIKLNLRETEYGDMYWFHLTQNRDQWRALVNRVIDLRVSKKCWEIFE
jgi:hypothetical protein